MKGLLAAVVFFVGCGIVAVGGSAGSAKTATGQPTVVGAPAVASAPAATRATQSKTADLQNWDRVLGEVKYGVEFLVSKMSLMEPRLSRMDLAIARLERNAIRDGLGVHAGHSTTSSTTRPQAFNGPKGCVTVDNYNGAVAPSTDLSGIAGQLQNLNEEQRLFGDLLRELRNYTAYSSSRILTKMSERITVSHPAVNIQTSRPVIVGGKPPALPSVDRPGKPFVVPVVEIKNNHKSSTASSGSYHADKVTGERRKDRLGGIFADLFGGTRANIGKHLRQVTEAIRRGAETPLAHGREYVEALEGEVRRLADFKEAVAESSASARSLQFRVFMDDTFEPLRATVSSLSKTVGKIERDIPPLMSRFGQTVNSLRTVFGELKDALNVSSHGDSYYVTLSEEDDFWK